MKLSGLNIGNSSRFKTVKLIINYQINESVQHDPKLLGIPAVSNWLKSHGIEVKNIPLHAEGSRGIVYFLDDKVVKFTDEPQEAKLAQLLKGSEFVAVIDVLQVGERLWAILQKQVRFDKRSKISRGFDYLAAYMDNHGPESILEDDVVDKVRAEWPESITANVEAAIDIILQIYNKTGTILDDPDISNIGLDDGKPVITDLGPK